MVLKDLIETMKRRNEENINLPEGETSDRILKVLRTERRKQLEAKEKEMLKAEITEENKRIVREDLFGFKGQIGDGRLGHIPQTKMNIKSAGSLGFGKFKGKKRKSLL